MLNLFNTLSLRLSRIMKMMMMILNKCHVVVFNSANIVILFFNTQMISIFFIKKTGTIILKALYYSKIT